MEDDKNVTQCEEGKNQINLDKNNKNNNNEYLEMNIEEEDKINNLQKMITKFMNDHTIYEAIPEDMKILVFNDELLIKDSIEAMIKEDIYCGLLYNSEQNKHSGVFTIRDVLGLLLVGYKKLVSFLNNNKNIDSYDTLKTNLNLLFSQFDNKSENIIELKDNNNQKKKNENEMDIEEDEGVTNESDPKIYNNIVNDFRQFISLFDNITLQSFIELFHIKENRTLI